MRIHLKPEKPSSANKKHYKTQPMLAMLRIPMSV
jgi:hypothetical protein